MEIPSCGHWPREHSGSMYSGSVWAAMQLLSIGEGDLLEVVVLVGVATGSHGQFLLQPLILLW